MDQSFFVHMFIHMQIYVNTVLNWKALDACTVGRYVQPILYVTNMSVDNQLATFARSHDWLVYEAPRVSRSGLPYLKDMFSHASRHVTNCTFYGFSNGDILYNRDLIVTLDAVAKVTATVADIVFVICQPEYISSWMYYIFHWQLLAHTMPCCPVHIVLYFIIYLFLLVDRINDDDGDNAEYNVIKTVSEVDNPL